LFVAKGNKFEIIFKLKFRWAKSKYLNFKIFIPIFIEKILEVFNYEYIGVTGWNVNNQIIHEILFQ
jgi:hypothetical protein